MIYLTGFADEANDNIDIQIKATKELGWNNIESRNINEKNIHDITDVEFDYVYKKLSENDIQINCFGSAIGNWAKKITDPFDISIDEAKRAISRMKKLNTKLIRIMSYAVIKENAQDNQMVKERIKRLNVLVEMFLSEGITPVHENCMNYGGLSYKHTLRLIEEVPNLKLVFDTGNPVFTDDAFTNKKQSAWEFYENIKDYIAYIHIKDAKIIDNKTVFTYPGEGDGDVIKILTDLLKNGYNGGISIEPHLAIVNHDQKITSNDDIRYNNYIEYGKKLEKIIENIKKS